MTTTTETIGNGYSRISNTSVYQVNRTGWRGVWDAILSAITGSTRPTVNQPLTFSVNVAEADAHLVVIGGMQVIAT